MGADVYVLHNGDTEHAAIRDLEEIVAAAEELDDKVWYDAHMTAVAEAAETGICPDCAGLGEGEVIAGRMEERYGLEELEPCCDFCTGVMYGKLEALRWVLGEEWVAPNN
jgi:hypothetical protein